MRCWRFGNGGCGVTFELFRCAFAVGVAGFDTEGFTFFSVSQGIGITRADFFAIRQPVVGDVTQAVFVSKGVGSAQGFANLGFAADGYAARWRVVGLRRGGRRSVQLVNADVIDFHRRREFVDAVVRILVFPGHVVATDCDVEAQVERDVERAGVISGVRRSEVINSVVVTAINVVFELAFLPFDGIGVPFVAAIHVGDALFVAVVAFAVASAPVSIGGNFDLPIVIAVFVVDVAAGFEDVYFATARPATIFGFVRTHPECRPQAAVFGIRHFQPCFKVAVSPRLFALGLHEA